MSNWNELSNKLQVVHVCCEVLDFTKYIIQKKNNNYSKGVVVLWTLPDYAQLCILLQNTG